MIHLLQILLKIIFSIWILKILLILICKVVVLLKTLSQLILQGVHKMM